MSTIDDAAENLAPTASSGGRGFQLDSCGQGHRSGAQRAVRRELDQSARVLQYHAINRMLNAQQPYLFAFVPDALIAAPPALRGLRPGSFSPYADVHRWWLQK